MNRIPKSDPHGEAHDRLPPGLADGGPERRTNFRFILFYRTAKLIIDGYEYLCILRDVSSSGIKIQLFHPLPEARKLAQIETGGGERYPLQLIWNTGTQAGFEFIGGVDVSAFVDNVIDHLPKREIRLSLSLDLRITMGSDIYPASLLNISQKGACIESSRWLMLEEPLRIDSDMLSPIHARVRWRRHPRYGLMFDQGFRFDELARLLGNAPRQARH